VPAAQKMTDVSLSIFRSKFKKTRIQMIDYISSAIPPKTLRIFIRTRCGANEVESPAGLSKSAVCATRPQIPAVGPATRSLLGALGIYRASPRLSRREEGEEEPPEVRIEKGCPSIPAQVPGAAVYQPCT